MFCGLFSNNNLICNDFVDAWRFYSQKTYANIKKGFMVLVWGEKKIDKNLA